MPSLASAVEEDVQQIVYFADDLLIDRSSRFFSSGVQVLLADSTGRCWQDRVPYNEARYLASLQRKNSPLAARLAIT